MGSKSRKSIYHDVNPVRSLYPVHQPKIATAATDHMYQIKELSPSIIKDRVLYFVGNLHISWTPADIASRLETVANIMPKRPFKCPNPKKNIAGFFLFATPGIGNLFPRALRIPNVTIIEEPKLLELRNLGYYYVNPEVLQYVQETERMGRAEETNENVCAATAHQIQGIFPKTGPKVDDKIEKGPLSNTAKSRRRSRSMDDVRKQVSMHKKFAEDIEARNLKSSYRILSQVNLKEPEMKPEEAAACEFPQIPLNKNGETRETRNFVEAKMSKFLPNSLKEQVQVIKSNRTHTEAAARIEPIFSKDGVNKALKAQKKSDALNIKSTPLPLQVQKEGKFDGATIRQNLLQQKAHQKTIYLQTVEQALGVRREVIPKVKELNEEEIVLMKRLAEIQIEKKLLEAQMYNIEAKVKEEEFKFKILD